MSLSDGHLYQQILVCDIFKGAVVFKASESFYRLETISRPFRGPDIMVECGGGAGEPWVRRLLVLQPYS